MYEYINGSLAELTPTYAVIEAGGVGYHIHISLHTFSQIEEELQRRGGEVLQQRLYTHYIVREDAQILFGFRDKVERELFRMLISVSGVGGNTARMVLSTYSPSELQSIIASENAVLLKSVKGLGLKTAQKIIVDLSGKMLTTSVVESGVEVVVSQSGIHDEAIEALVMLGFAKTACQKVVSATLKSAPNSSVEEVIRKALKQL
ncbi:MAG: Holliday junction branch migration protein RuvA [Rikenellaceae bacterium]